MEKMCKLLYAIIIFLLAAIASIQIIDRWYSVRDIPEVYLGDYVIVELKVDTYTSDNIKVFKNGLLQDIFDEKNDQIKIILKEGDIIEIDGTKNTRRHDIHIRYMLRGNREYLFSQTITVDKGIYRFPPFSQKNLVVLQLLDYNGI